MGPPAPFWRRYAAYSLDGAIVALLALPLLAWLLRGFPAALAAAMAALQQRMLEQMIAAMDQPADPFALAIRLSTDAAIRDAIAALAGLLTQGLLATTAAVVAVAAAWFIGFEAS